MTHTYKYITNTPTKIQILFIISGRSSCLMPANSNLIDNHCSATSVSRLICHLIASHALQYLVFSALSATSGKWYLIIILICISSLINDIFSGAYWAFVYLLLQWLCSIFPLIFEKLGCLFNNWMCRSSPYTVHIS